jgi:hypothetical protein
MRARLLLLLAVAVTFVKGNAELALAFWNAAGAGASGARAAVLAPPTGLTVTGQSRTPTADRAGIVPPSSRQVGPVTQPAAAPAGSTGTTS